LENFKSKSFHRLHTASNIQWEGDVAPAMSPSAPVFPFVFWSKTGPTPSPRQLLFYFPPDIRIMTDRSAILDVEGRTELHCG
jgi:hypothetical protein